MIMAILAQQAAAQTRGVESGKNLKKSIAEQPPQPRHSLTIGVPSFFDGFTAVTYERGLSTRLSIAAAAGITYNSYFMQVRDQRIRDERYTGSSTRTGPNTFDVEEEFNNRFYHEAKPGIYLALTPKFYLSQKALDGFYIAPMLEFRDYRFRTFKGNESVFYAPYLTSLTEKSVQRVREDVSESFRCYDVSAIAGGHHQMRSHLVIGYHIGIGVRHSVTNRQDFGLECVREEFYRFTNGTARIAENRLIANFGFSVGGFW